MGTGRGRTPGVQAGASRATSAWCATRISVVFRSSHRTQLEPRQQDQAQAHPHPSPPTPPSPPSPPGPPSATHYEDPKGGCRSDEVDITIQGIQGAVCSPACTMGIFCPSDVPAGATAAPQCALQDSSTQKKYCVLICSPSSNDAQCGTNASCKSISGTGLCTYDDAVDTSKATTVKYDPSIVV